MTRIAACAVVLLIGCVDPDDQPVTWSYVYTTIVQPNCTSSNCHSELTAAAGLAFHEREQTYELLVGGACDGANVPVGDFVVPYEPGRSKLMYMLRGEETRQMPPDVGLPEVEMDLVERWIAEGAICE